jgi:hypothetical protein
MHAFHSYIGCHASGGALRLVYLKPAFRQASRGAWRSLLNIDDAFFHGAVFKAKNAT